MGAFTSGLIAAMKADGTLVALLSTYKSSPAVFSCYPVPEEASLPYVVLSPSFSDDDMGSKDVLLREFDREVLCFTDNTGSAAAVEAIAEAVRDLFHNGTVAVTGYTQTTLRASGPTGVNVTDHNVTARAVIIEGRYTQN